MLSQRIAPFLFLVTFSLPAAAQQVTPVIPAPNPSHADTVRAVQRIFQKHRTGGWIWTTIGGILALRIATVAISSSSSGSFSSNTGGTLTGLGVFGGIPAGIGVGKLTRFSQMKEAQVISLYAKSEILPPYIRRRLKPKYFRY